jgi:hypothetical protein
MLIHKDWLFSYSLHFLNCHQRQKSPTTVEPHSTHALLVHFNLFSLEHAHACQMIALVAHSFVVGLEILANSGCSVKTRLTSE